MNILWKRWNIIQCYIVFITTSCMIESLSSNSWSHYPPFFTLSGGGRPLKNFFFFQYIKTLSVAKVRKRRCEVSQGRVPQVNVSAYTMTTGRAVAEASPNQVPRFSYIPGVGSQNTKVFAGENGAKKNYNCKIRQVISGILYVYMHVYLYVYGIYMVI